MRCPVLAWCFLAFGMAGCDRPAPPPVTPALPAAQGDAIEWQGALACADCAAIQVDLVLRNDNGRRRYLLTEVYLAEGGGTRFVEPGNWQRTRALLRLQGDGGSVRVFALLPDGRLQARDRHGRRTPAAGASDLLPVAITRSEPAPADAWSP